MPTYNKVTLNGTTLMDLSQDTVTSSDHIVQGRVGHLANGTQVTGTYQGGGGGTDFVITLAYDLIERNVYGWVPDKTSAEIYEAYSDGLNIVVVADKSSTSNPVVAVDGEYFSNYGQLYYHVAEDVGSSTYEIAEYDYISDTVEMISDELYYVPNLQSKSVTPALYAQLVQADSGYDGLSSVAVGAMPSGTAGTPTATKGTVSNHSISITPSVTNTTGYITGSTKTGTAVTVSASELVSGSETKTSNGTYNVTNLAQLVVNVPTGSSKNVQTAQSTTRATSSTYTDLISLTCSVTGTYTVRWSTFRSSTSGTWGSQLYINGTAYGSAQTGSWSNHIQNITLTGVSISANQTVSVYVRTRGSNYYGYVGTLVIEQTA